MYKNIWKDAVAIITGGGSGIGRALATAMAKRGALVMVTDIDLDKATLVANECGINAQSYLVDVRDANQVNEMVNQVFHQYGRVDFIFNNAGIGVAGETYLPATYSWRLACCRQTNSFENGSRRFDVSA